MTTETASDRGLVRLAMSQAWKDVVVLRHILLAWVAITIALHAAVLVAAWSSAPPGDSADRLALMFRVLLPLNVAGFFAVTVLVVQTDPATSPAAFWVTRPIPPWLLLASKGAVLTCLVVVFPLVADALTVVTAGLRPEVAPMLQSVVVQCAWLLPTMALAAFTGSLARFAVACVVEFVGYLLLITIFTWTIGFTDPLVKSGTISVVFIVGLMTAAAAVLAVSYGRRDFRTAALVAAAAPVALCVTVALWPPGAQMAARQRPRALTARDANQASVRLAIGARYRLPSMRGQVADIDAQRSACYVAVREVSATSKMRAASYSATLVNETRGERLPLASFGVRPLPFVTMFLPVPQHLAVGWTTLHFPWTPRPAIDLPSWLKDATLVVQERR